MILIPRRAVLAIAAFANVIPHFVEREVGGIGVRSRVRPFVSDHQKLGDRARCRIGQNPVYRSSVRTEANNALACRQSADARTFPGFINNSDAEFGSTGAVQVFPKATFHVRFSVDR